MIIREEAADSSHSPPQATSPSSGRSPHGSATFLNQAPNGRSGRGGDSSPGSPPSRSAPEQGQRKRDLVDSLNQPQGKMTVKEKSLTPLCGWEAVSSVSPSQSGYAHFCKREGVTSSGVSQLRCLGSALPAFSTTVTGRANDRHSGRGVRPRRGFYLTEKTKTRGNKVSKRGTVSKTTGNLVSSSCCGVRGGLAVFTEGRVQVRGGVRRPHALPSSVRGARGGGFF